MNISLTPEQQRFIEEKVASGQYHTAAEVVREGIRMLMWREERQRAELDLLRNEIHKGTESADAGRLRGSEEVGRELHRKIRPSGESA